MYKKQTFKRMVHEVEGKYISTYTFKTIPKEEREQIKSSRDIQEHFRAEYEANKFSIESKEYFFIALLNNANFIMNIECIGIGGLTGCVADPSEICRKAILAQAKGVILCHNHPSGSLKPSEADTKLTAKVKDSLKLFDTTLMDHLILTDSSYVSFADEVGCRKRTVKT